MTITFSLFEQVSDGTVEKAYTEAERLGEFIGGKGIKVSVDGNLATSVDKMSK